MQKRIAKTSRENGTFTKRLKVNEVKAMHEYEFW